MFCGNRDLSFFCSTLCLDLSPEGSSESDAVISRILPLRLKRKFSRIGSGDFAGIALETAITPLSNSELEMISFIIMVLNIDFEYWSTGLKLCTIANKYSNIFSDGVKIVPKYTA